MDAQRKDIQNLTELLDEKRNELNELYRNCGEKILQEAGAHDALSVLLGRERVDTWKALMDSRENDTRAILEIKDVLARMQELKQFHQEIERNRSDNDSDYRAVLEKIGHACYERYAQGNTEAYSEFWEKASAEGSSIVSLEDKQNKLKTDMKDAGMIQRMMLQLKLSANDTAIKHHRERMMKNLTEGARMLVEDGILENQLESGQLGEQFDHIMTSLRTTTGKQRDLDERKKSLSAENTALEENLEKYGARDNPSRRIEGLHAKIHDTDRRITTLSVMAARDYFDTIFNEEGERKEVVSVPEVTSLPLEQVGVLRAGISNTRKNIEILEANLKIAALDRTLSTIDRSCSDFEKKIRQYQEQLEKMDKSREDTIRERNKLEDYRNSIQKALG